VIESGQTLQVIVPFYNEVESLPQLHAKLKQVFTQAGIDGTVIYVDDGSVDSSWEQVEQWVTAGECSAIKLVRNFGKEAAIRAGLQEAQRTGVTPVVVMDADLQHPPELIPSMLELWKSSRSWVIEGRKKGNLRRSGTNQLGAKVVYKFLEVVTGIQFEGRSDFCLIDPKVVELLNQLPERITFFRGVVSWFGFPSQHIDFEVPAREHGSGKWSKLKLIQLALDMITGFTAVPLSIVTVFSMLFLLFSGILMLQTLYMYLSSQAVEGFTTVIICILMVGSVLAGGMGILGQYLARIYEEVKNRPVYIPEEVIRPSDSAKTKEKSD